MTEENKEYKDEIWKDVPHEPFNKTYAVSNYGRIKNKNTEYVKKQQISTTGYPSVKLDMKKQGSKTFDMHVLIARTFYGERPSSKHLVNHKDGNKTNNKLENLEYTTENTKHYHKQLKGKHVEHPQFVKTSDYIKNTVKELDFSNIKMEDMEVKEIEGFTKYVINKVGNVYNKDTHVSISQFSSENGYKRCSLSCSNEDGKTIRKKPYVQCLVAKAFIPNPNNLPKVNHMNANKKDNRVENLEWCTHSENMKYDAKLRKTLIKVGAFDPYTDELIHVYESKTDASKKTGIILPIIVKNSKAQKEYGGCVWKELNDDNTPKEKITVINKKSKKI